MTLHDWLTQAEKQTDDAAWLAAKAFGKDRTWVAANRSRTKLTAAKQTQLNALLKRRLKDEPLAYILGSEPFFGRDFFVDKRVLIPRPETEDLVTEALKIPADVYVDIGTGSGAIAVTLAAESPSSRIIASDSSSQALLVAKNNARKHAPGRIRFFHGPLLRQNMMEQIINTQHLRLVLVANLPYLPFSDKNIMPKSVTKYEPSKALYTDDEGMKLNKRLLQQLAKLYHSRATGGPIAVLLEFDPPQSKKLLAFAKSLFPNADGSIIRDRCGRERILKIIIPQTSHHRS